MTGRGLVRWTSFVRRNDVEGRLPGGAQVPALQKRHMPIWAQGAAWHGRLLGGAQVPALQKRHTPIWAQGAAWQGGLLGGAQVPALQKQIGRAHV